MTCELLTLWHPAAGSHLVSNAGSPQSVQQPGSFAGIFMVIMSISTSPDLLRTVLQNDLVPHGFVLHPKDFSHVLVIVKLGGCYRWSYTPESWLYRQACDETKRFDDSVAKVRGE